MGIQRADVEQMVREALMRRLRSGRTAQGGPPPSVERRASSALLAGAPNPLVVNVSARHMHVKPSDLEILFGPGATLSKMKDLYQQGEFASEQLVTLVGPRQRIIPNVRILGPTRDYSQVELSYTDGVYLGIDLPLRISGNHEGTPGILVLGPTGSI
ncbi:MAG TPA: PduL/EutD family phosphate acyltransferase, partial [Tepidisphaeraceae bacterium]|nr:PduL/EutD family phosphate acyltransferase [Tepidisphaeraceae bacterium]